MNTLRFISQINNDYKDSSDEYQKLLNVISTLFKKGIKCNYDGIDNPQGSSRIILYSNRYNLQNYNIARECNGLILDYKTWSVISYPPELANAKYNFSNVYKNFDKYDIYKIEDGTIVTLYYYGDKWCLSTVKGIDVGPLEWCGIKYDAAFQEASSKYPNFTTEKLDKNTCYTIGLQHPLMHPYSADTKLWFVSSYDTKTETRKYDDDIGIPLQEKGEVKTFAELKNKLSTKESFGFILRSRNPQVTTIDSTILFESFLMKNIRRLFYDRKLTEEANAIGINRTEYILTLSFVEKSRLPIFRHTFPRYNNLMDEFEKKQNSLIQNIIEKNTSCDFANMLIGEIAKTVSNFTMNEQDIAAFISTKNYIVQWHKYLFSTSELIA